MSNKRKFYSIHNILNFAVIDRTGYFNRLFNNFDIHYENFIMDGKIEDCDLIIEIGKFKPDLDNTYVVGDGKYYFPQSTTLVVPDLNASLPKHSSNFCHTSYFIFHNSLF